MLKKQNNKGTDTDNEAAAIIKQCENVRAYKNSMGFDKSWKEYIDFVEDRQWIKTEKNKNMPKPVHNIIKLAKRIKTSAVLSDNIKIMYSPVELIENDIANEASNMFNAAVEQTIETVDQEKLDYEVTNDAFTLGTGIVHYYWNNSVIGGYKNLYKGDIKGESIDPSNFFPGNPQEKDINKQPFIIITYRDLVENIKNEAKNNKVSPELMEQITGDKDTSQESYDASKKEVDGADKTTVYLKYWREKGKIYFQKCVKGCVFKPKTVLWNYSGADVEPYPIAYFDWEDRKKCLFGIGEVEGMIYNQKSINFIQAIQILNIQDTGWSKYIVKYDALQQTMQNVPGEVIKDMSNQPGDNIKAMQPAQMSNQAFQLVDDMIANTRTFNGVSETVTGESIGANTSAAAIIALQNQAKVPLDAARKKFYRYRKNIAKIWEFFYKCYYNLPRNVQSTDELGNKASSIFTGTDYKDVPLHLKIDVGAGSSYSESLAVQTLDNFLAKGYITPLQYVQLAPKNVVPFAEQFIQMMQQQQQDQLVQATQALQKSQATIQSLQGQLQQHKQALQAVTQGGVPSGNVP